MHEPYIYNRHEKNPTKNSPVGNIIRGKSKFATLTAVLGLALALTLTTNQVMTQQDSRSRASFTASTNNETTTPAQNKADLYLYTRQATLEPGEQFSVDLILKPNNILTSFITTKINYPQNSIEPLDITKGPLFQNDFILDISTPGTVNIEISNGLIALNQQKTQGIVATILFKVKNTATSPIELTFDRNTSYILSVNRDTDAGENVIGITQPLSLPLTSDETLIGDTNMDGEVDILDYNTMTTEFGKSGTHLKTDFNKNGVVDIQDFNLFVTYFGKTQ